MVYPLTVKPGFQREILVAYWLLFDEFGIGDDDPPAQPPADSASTTPSSTASPSDKKTGD